MTVNVLPEHGPSYESAEELMRGFREDIEQLSNQNELEIWYPEKVLKRLDVLEKRAGLPLEKLKHSLVIDLGCGSLGTQDEGNMAMLFAPDFPAFVGYIQGENSPKKSHGFDLFDNRFPSNPDLLAAYNSLYQHHPVDLFPYLKGDESFIDMIDEEMEKGTVGKVDLINSELLIERGKHYYSTSPALRARFGEKDGKYDPDVEREIQKAYERLLDSAEVLLKEGGILYINDDIYRKEGNTLKIIEEEASMSSNNA